jgi:small conductance mechanosensitive channel
MKDQQTYRKILTAIELAVLAVFLGFFVFCIVSQFTNEQAAYAVWIRDNVWNVKNTLTTLKNHIPTIIRCAIYIVIIYALCRLVRLFFSNKMKKSNRTKTIFTLLDGFIKYGGAIAIIFCILKACGVDTGALAASVGVLTLVVGLGANALIADIIAGIFIIFENEYNVGEIISIDDFRGTVIEIGIRSTKLLDAAGNIKIINNGNIGDIVNLSRELSLAVADCDFPYDVPVEYLENIIEKNLPRIKERIPAIVDGPFYKGVCEYKDSNVTIKIIAKCLEEDRFQVQRDLLREYRFLLTENNIDIAFPQVVLNQPEKKEYVLAKKDRKQAQEFVDEQKELSDGMEEQHN